MLKFWHIASGAALHTIHEHRQILAASVNPAATQIITAGSTEQLNIYDIESGTKIKVCEPRWALLLMGIDQQRSQPEIFFGGEFFRH